ncbi:Uncharacterised protein [Leclercia adecarboxylata]|uniref:Uncharacterized protein n=1 Tax=Leclercia adecarboxylata TaxID=83655 RepID=A0A4U9HXH3_9ENTR|nr:Uncharacterised protein [Leclercia adecarboxylata]
MSQTTTLRVLFCIGVNQNFFDATPAEAKQVWGAFGVMMKGIDETQGIRVIGNMDDDRLMVGRPPPRRGPPTCWPMPTISTAWWLPATCSAPPRWATARASCGSTARSKPAWAVN